MTINTLLEAGDIEPADDYVMAFCDGGYTTNLPVEDLLDGKAMVAHEYNGAPLPPEHGGPPVSWCPTSTCGNRPSGSAA